MSHVVLPPLTEQRRIAEEGRLRYKCGVRATKFELKNGFGSFARFISLGFAFPPSTTFRSLSRCGI
jgi:hypothetical protein